MSDKPFQKIEILDECANPNCDLYHLMLYDTFGDECALIGCVTPTNRDQVFAALKTLCVEGPN